ncbi:replicative DNA helicase [Hellea balneolensis]|uniref:replicative DNA helicase n=1 Tax=Hellea balneolensis TaxID=287478 RepID=UPI0004021AA0|nr:replicative DNA helicase [Hellea balneolensis]
MALIQDNDAGISSELDSTPQSQEAEQALIGALLYDNEVYHRISGIVQAKHFYNPVHVRIFDSIAILIERGNLADAIVLKNRFSQDETLVDIGGVEYLALLLDNAPPGSTAPEYAKLILDMAMRRELIRLADGIKGEATDPDSEQDAQNQITSAESQLYNLAEIGGTQSGFVSFENALIKSIEMASAAFSRDGHLSGTSTGLIDLDRQLGGMHRSDLIILAGRPSMGKTSLATNIAFNIAKKFKREKDDNGIEKTVEGGVVGFFSLEMSSEQLATRLLAEHSQVPSHKIRRGDITAEQYEHIRDSADEINRIPLHIDDTGGISIGALSARARRLKRMVGLDMIVVDYLQLLTGGAGMNSSTNRVQEVSMITQGLKALAKELDIPVLALAQLSRQVEQRDDKRPQLSDLRESGSIEQDADVVMFVFREEYYVARSEPSEGTEEHLKWQEDMEQLHGKAEVIIGKQRHGPIGTVKLSFNPDLTKFGNLAQDDRFEGGH